MFYAEGTHPAIIDEETFAAAKAKLDEISAFTAGRGKRTYSAFTGIIICSQCGRSYKRITNHNRHAWNCTTYVMEGKRACPGLQIREDVLQKAAADALGLVEYNESVFRESIDSVSVGVNHILTFHFRDGHSVEVEWNAPSRSHSWTPEMRAAAAERTRKQRRKP